MLDALHRSGPWVDDAGYATRRLAEHLGWDRQSLNTRLAAMEADGLIRRERRHSRVFRIELTADGLELLDTTDGDEPGDEPGDAGALGGAQVIDTDFYDRRRAAAAAAI